MMNQYNSLSVAPPSLLSRDYPVHLVEEEIKQSSKEDHRDDGNTLPISAKTVHPLQDIFRTIPPASPTSSSSIYEDSNMPRGGVVSYASDSDYCEMSDDPDPTIPLDYRRDWSFDIQNTLQMVLHSNTLFQDINDDDELDEAMDCTSIASIDVGSDYEDEINSPMSEWIQIDDVIW